MVINVLQKLTMSAIHDYFLRLSFLFQKRPKMPKIVMVEKLKKGHFSRPSHVLKKKNFRTWIYVLINFLKKLKLSAVHHFSPGCPFCFRSARKCLKWSWSKSGSFWQKVRSNKTRDSSNSLLTNNFFDRLQRALLHT